MVLLAGSVCMMAQNNQPTEIQTNNTTDTQMTDTIPMDSIFRYENLMEVVVKGTLPHTRLRGNSMVTTITGTALSQSGSALEMLGKVPGMTRKGESVEVLGKGTPVYYINGRKMQDQDELKRLRSEEIHSVEVITNPGAQYDATISAVVRIKTVKRQGDGFGFDVMASNSQDLRYGYTDPSSTVNLRYRHNSLDVFGTVNYRKYDGLQDSEPNQESYIRKGDGELLSISQRTHLRHDTNAQGINTNIGFNYQIAADHSIGMRVERHDRFHSGVKARIETEMTMSPIVARIQGLGETSRNRSEQNIASHQPFNWDGNAYYVGKVGKLGIDLNLDFMTSKESEDNIIKEWKSEGADAEGVTSTMTHKQNSSARLVADKLVLSYPIWKGELQAGTEMSFVKKFNAYAISGYPLPATEAEVKEASMAGFVQYNCEIPQVGSFSAGLRYEHVGFKYNDRLDEKKSMERFTDDLFPSLAWGRSFGPVQASLAWSIKTIRPNYQMLDESTLYINSYSLQQGNPTLRNSIMNEVSANAHWKWLNLYMAYERRDHAHSIWSYIYNDEGVILVKNINLEKPVRNFAAFLSASPSWGVYSASWTAGWQKFFYSQTLADPREASGQREVSYSKPIMYFDINNCIRLKHKWQFEANMNITTKGDVMNCRLKAPSYNMSLVLQKSWLKNDALSLRATVNDVIQKSRTVMELDCGYYTLNQKSRNNLHSVYVSLRYTFNASKDNYKGTGAGKDAKSRF